MGSILDLPSSEWFGSFSTQLTVHVIDSSRPQNLASVFGGGENGERIIVWDDGGAEDLQEERKAWEALTVSTALTIACLSFSEPGLGGCSMNLNPTRMKTILILTPKRTQRTKAKTTTKMNTKAATLRGSDAR